MKDLLDGRTQREIARFAGISDAAASRFFRGVSVPNGIPFTKISQALGVSTSELVRRFFNMKEAVA